MLRIDPTPSGKQAYGVPDGNPFAGGGGRGEIYAYGLRNPWRYSFDRGSGDLTIGDVGQNSREEVDLVARGRGRGANFGWSAYEADQRFNSDQRASDAVEPVLAYPTSGGNCAVTGGYVVRDSGPALALRALSVRGLLSGRAAQLPGQAGPARR